MRPWLCTADKSTPVQVRGLTGVTDVVPVLDADTVIALESDGSVWSWGWNGYGVLGQGAYELDDGTGKIWVLAERAVPARGSHVEAKGHVITGFVYRGRNLAAAIRETGRKAKDRH